MKTRCLALLADRPAPGRRHAKDAKKKDLDKLQGTWAASTIEYNGEKVLGDLVKDLKVVVEGDSMTIKSEARRWRSTARRR